MIIHRAFKAGLLDRDAYAFMPDDKEPIFDVLCLVCIVAVAFALGVGNQSSIDLMPLPLYDYLVTGNTILIGWGLWAASIWFIEGRLFNRHVTYRKLLRGIGTAYGPGIFMVLVPLPLVGPWICLLVRIWMLATVTIAIREIQKQTLVRALGTSLVGWWLSQVLLPVFILPVGVCTGVNIKPPVAEHLFDIVPHSLLNFLYGFVL